jgi:hypothetical protein
MAKNKPINKQTASEYGKLGVKVREENKRLGVERLMTFLRDGGSQRVEELFERMLKDQELTKGELEFLKHYKDLMEYHTPKLSRTELTGKGGMELFPREQAKKLLNGSNES